MKRKMNGTNTSPPKPKTQKVRGTGKSQPTAPSATHKKGGAVKSPKKAKGPLDNRGKDSDRNRMR